MSLNNQENKTQTSIYRFKFTPDFTQLLFEFSKLHRFDDRHTFREAWELWLDENNDEVCKETRYLSNLGYEGDVLDKMYKSSRYYFRKKSTSKVEPKKRRVYVKRCIFMLNDAFLCQATLFYVERCCGLC